MYKQLKHFDPAKGGTTKYLCLSNVRKGFSIPAKYDSAWTAWTKTQQHPDRNFPALDIPLYYRYTATIDGIKKNWGHINVRLADGRIWNDGKIYADMASFEHAYSNVKFVGWGESINDVKVIEQGGDMPSKVNRDLNRIIHSEMEGWDYRKVHNGDYDETFKGWNGSDLEAMIWSKWNQNAPFREARERNRQFFEKYNSVIGELSARPTKAEYEAALARIAEEAAKAEAANKAAEEAKKQGGISPEDSAAIKETNAIVKAIKSFLERIFR